MDKKDFNIGQTVYLKVIPGSNASRYIDKSNPDEWIKERVVIKIGSKFLTVAIDNENRGGEEKFHIQNISTHRHDVGQNYKLYLTKESILEDQECENLYRKIKNGFSDWGNEGKYSLDQLRCIIKTLELK
uniref:beta barrel domain-containing protein n=1 Tax=Clostridium sp. 12(A) TaxID=1163671 RepID=UPI0004672014|nr:hypothetical protein [Clostridium sp. 12(A)]